MAHVNLTVQRSKSKEVHRDALTFFYYFITFTYLQGDYQTVDSLEPALLNDARASSYPITVDNGTPSEAMEPFDRITSDKVGEWWTVYNNITRAEQVEMKQ